MRDDSCLRPSHPVSSLVHPTPLCSHDHLPTSNHHLLAWLLQLLFPQLSPHPLTPLGKPFPPSSWSHQLWKCEFNHDPYVLITQHIWTIASASGLPTTPLNVPYLYTFVPLFLFTPPRTSHGAEEESSTSDLDMWQRKEEADLGERSTSATGVSVVKSVQTESQVK